VLFGLAQPASSPRSRFRQRMPYRTRKPFDLQRLTNRSTHPDDATAKQLSKTEGLTVAEASRRLRIMGELGRLAPALSARFPKGFAGAEATTGSDFRVAIYGVVLIPREAAPSFRNDAAPLFRELLAP
jgi:hypothetical protein